MAAKPSAVLTVTMPTEREILMTRVFDAPRPLVFEACTRAEHLVHWFGPRGYTLPVCEVDFRVGGAWRFLLRGPDGREMGMHGVYREITPPERVVHTEIFDDFAEHETVVTTTFVEHEGQTTFTVTVLYPSREVRDAVVQSGMAKGAAETYDRMAEHLVAMARE